MTHDFLYIADGQMYFYSTTSHAKLHVHFLKIIVVCTMFGEHADMHMPVRLMSGHAEFQVPGPL